MVPEVFQPDHLPSRVPLLLALPHVAITLQPFLLQWAQAQITNHRLTLVQVIQFSERQLVRVAAAVVGLVASLIVTFPDQDRAVGPGAADEVVTMADHILARAVEDSLPLPSVGPATALLRLTLAP
jgi:hypothetical protein